MVTIYTDGGCSPNPGPGGWSIVISPLEYHRGQKKMTTNNEMELTAVKNAIIYARKYYMGDRILIKSDSKYCVDGFNSWMHNWAKNDFKKKKGELKNQNLWRELYQLRHGVTLQWVKGHNGDRLNELADNLATWIDPENERLDAEFIAITAK